MSIEGWREIEKYIKRETERETEEWRKRLEEIDEKTSERKT